jgi:hypothetical protein
MARSHPRLLVLAALVAAGSLFASCKGGAKADAAGGAYAAYQPAGFDKLASFVMEALPVDPAADKSVKPKVDESKIPADVKALNGKDVRITGFMIPVKLVNGLVTEFLVVKDQTSCCYGGSPNPNHWVMVRLPKGVKNIQDTPVHVYGRLTVGPVFDTSNYLIAIYSMDAEAAVGAPDVYIDNGQ